MQRQDRVDIPVTLQIPAFSDQTRRYQGTVIGFFGNSVFIVMDEPVMVNGHPEQIVRIPASLPIPVGARFVQGKGWIEIDLRFLCTSGACMNPPTTLVAYDKEHALYCDECTTIMKQSAHFVSATPLAMIGEQKGHDSQVPHEEGGARGNGSIRVTLPPTANSRRVVTLLLARRDLAQFAFSRQKSGECILHVPYSHRDWLLPEIEEIRESGLDDEDGPNAWFRYKGMLISYVGDRTYWYRLWTAEMEDEKKFDVRNLEAWDGDEMHIKQIIKAAIDRGELSPHAGFLRDLSSDKE